MKSLFQNWLALCIGLFAIHATATTYYVDINSSNPTPPYTGWSTAATNIQDAVAQTVNGDSILVNPGAYTSSGSLAPDGTLTVVDVTNAITIQSVDGESGTVINGSNAMRCVYLTSGASLYGFTLTDGNAPLGGGIYCASTNGTIISNCVLFANFASNQGGGAYQGTYFNCRVSRNQAPSGGGFANAIIFGSLIISNEAFTFTGNINNENGGGAYNSSIFSSAIADNEAVSDGGGAYGGTLVNCTVTGNTANQAGGGTASCVETNCIVYYNKIYSNPPESLGTNTFSDELYFCCTTPDPGTGYAVITNEPILADISHISLASPCHGAGEPVAADTTDIDGNPWNNPPSIGCSEIPFSGDYGNLVVNITTPFTNWAVGYSLGFQTANSGPDYNTVWNFGDGTIVTNTPYISHTWSAAGTYPVTLTAYNDSYPAGITATQMISITVPSVYYVNLNNFNPVPPYMTWDTAALNIQDAVNVAPPGSLILVTNGPTTPYTTVPLGFYYITNSAAFYLNGGATAPDGNFYRVVITNAITVQSVSGPATTYIWGPTPTPGNPNADFVYLANGATLNGFTLTNYFSGFGAYGQVTATSTNAAITNCLFTHYVPVNSGTLNNCSFVGYSGANNSTLDNCVLTGLGYSENSKLNSCIVSNNGSVLGGVLNNCILVNNTNLNNAQGGAATAAQGYPLVLNNCIISNNVSLNVHGGGYGGAIYNSFNSTPTYYTNCILNNCTLVGNSAQIEAGGAYGAELNNCLIISNSASSGAGVEGGFLNNCTLIGNSNNAALSAVLTNCTLIGNAGSGASGCSLNQCTLLHNVGRLGAGANNSTLNNCLIISNATTSVAGNGGGAYGCSLTNCILADNISTNGGGAYQSTLVNCTVVANTSAHPGGGIYDSTAENCIIYYNTNGDFYPNTYALNYCCVSVAPSYGSLDFRNITNVPLFVNLAGGDFHLQSSSPCINSGNNAYISNTTDLDGNARIQGGTVDIGAYEYQTPTSVISYAFLQQYGLPTDGSVDFADLDGTAFNVYQDWIAGLNPTNPASILAMKTPVTATAATGVKVTWQSVSGIPYFLQRSTNLLSQPPFSTIQNNITGQTNTTSYTDTSATNNVPYFYRVGVIAP